MMSVAVSLIVGMLMGAGLAVSQMMDPSKVLDFLDFAGNWDPTLATVMAGAILAAFPGFAFARKRQASLFGNRFQIPSRRDIDRDLIAGAAMFGIGWGLVGFCPGPALAAIGLGLWQVHAFVAAMMAGMLLYRLFPLK